MGFVVGYVLWQITVLADEFGRPRPAESAAGTLFWLAVVFGVVWFAFGIRYAIVMRRIKSDPVVSRALDDERVRGIRGSAYAIGFWSLGAYLIAARLLAFIVEIPGSIIAQAGIGVGLASAVIAFLVLDRG